MRDVFEILEIMANADGTISVVLKLTTDAHSAADYAARQLKAVCEMFRVEPKMFFDPASQP
jgi:hypothetical protein